MPHPASYIASGLLRLVLIACLTAGVFYLSSYFPKQDNATPGCATVTTEPMLYSNEAIKGKSLYLTLCASCHHVIKDATGPRLADIMDSEFWAADFSRIVLFLREPGKAIKRWSYLTELVKSYNGMVHPAFPQLGKSDILDIIAYTIASKTTRTIY